MDPSNFPPSIISQLAEMVHKYIVSSRKRYIGRSVALSQAQRFTMKPFFAADILDHTRLVVLHGERIEDPPFYTMARTMGIKNLPAFSDMGAVTFNNLIVSYQEFTDDLLFHELVHVAQYAAMETKEFAEKYVAGFITGGSYEEIPLEKMAYKLEHRFSRNRVPFSVPDEVRLWREAGKL